VTFEDLLSRLSAALDRARVPYMLTGSVASSAHGAPRSTRDVDVVIAPTREQLIALLREFPSSYYYADEQQALQAFANRSQFNVIDFSTGWKVDFIFADESEYGRTALGRRLVLPIAGTAVYVASPEDVLLAKLRWAKLGGSDRQLQDAAGILSTQGVRLDSIYIERWVGELGLKQQWDEVRDIE
jgi:hypothetical protein